MYCYNYNGTADNSCWGTAGALTVYYDATLSKLSYKDTGGVKMVEKEFHIQVRGMFIIMLQTERLKKPGKWN